MCFSNLSSSVQTAAAGDPAALRLPIGHLHLLLSSAPEIPPLLLPWGQTDTSATKSHYKLWQNTTCKDGTWHQRKLIFQLLECQLKNEKIFRRHCPGSLHSSYTAEVLCMIIPFTIKKKENGLGNKGAPKLKHILGKHLTGHHYSGLYGGHFH